MRTISVDLDERLVKWLREQSVESGMSPEELAGEILRRQVIAERFLALTNRMGQEAAERGLTAEELDRLLGEEDV